MESFPAAQTGRPKASQFVVARLRHDSGDWDYNPKVSFPFLFMTGHKLVRFSSAERAQRKTCGFLFSDDCNHDVEAPTPRASSRRCTRFPGAGTLAKPPATHPLYRCSFQFPAGPPTHLARVERLVG